jgi:hypothetical protein
MKKLITCFWLWAVAQAAVAQSFEWKFGGSTFCDNREYFNPIQYPQTIFGANFSPEIGVALDSTNRFRVGITLLHEFGSPRLTNRQDLIMYYHYDRKPFQFWMGMFPRRNLLTDYPRALLIDTLQYFRPNIEGMLLKWNHRGGSQRVWIDWTSRQTDFDRETFLFGMAGSYQQGVVFSSYHFMMYHFAGPGIPIPDDHIRDNGAALVKLGLDLSRKTVFDTLSVNVAGMMSFERERSIAGFRTPSGAMFEFAAGWKRLLLLGTFYRGQGHRLDFGDAFYKAKSYGRLDFNWTPIEYRGLRGRFTYSLHFIGNDIDNQQAFVLTYQVGGAHPFRRKP